MRFKIATLGEAHEILKARDLAYDLSIRNERVFKLRLNKLLSETDGYRRLHHALRRLQNFASCLADAACEIESPENKHGT